MAKSLGQWPQLRSKICIWIFSPVALGWWLLILESLQQENERSERLVHTSEDLEIQTAPLDSDLFQASETSLPRPPQPDVVQRGPNYSTVRIYGNALHLSDSTTPERIRPSVITVERAALCSIFLETKYHRTLKEPSEREVRQQTLRDLVCKGRDLTPPQKERFNEILNSIESEWSRLSRGRPSKRAFEHERKLGSGGFGVVNMVKEKATGTVYAMKVSHCQPAEISLFQRTRHWSWAMKVGYCVSEIFSRKRQNPVQDGSANCTTRFRTQKRCNPE